MGIGQVVGAAGQFRAGQRLHHQRRCVGRRTARQQIGVSPVKKPWPLTWTKSKPAVQPATRRLTACKNACTSGRSSRPWRQRMSSAYSY